MELSHYSDKIINVLDRDYTYPESYHKPNGFWVSVDGNKDWKAWCESEDFLIEKLVFKHNIILSEKNNILYLDNDNEILKFNDDYVIGDKKDYGNKINWSELKKDYQGIVIAPYSFNLRFDMRTHWYYTWDCASGCIWDLNAIDRIEVEN